MEWYVEVNFILLWTWRTFKDKQGLSSRWVGQGDPVEILISVLPFAITAPSISTGGPWDDSPSSIWYSTIMCYSWNPYYHKWRCSVGESKFKQWSRVWALLLGKILRREGWYYAVEDVRCTVICTLSKDHSSYHRRIRVVPHRIGDFKGPA